MTQKRTSRIDRIGATTGQYFNRNLDWFFSDNIEDWIHSKRRTANKRIVEWERNRRNSLKTK